jgi:hypothetical protein
MDRREFLRQTGRGIAVASLAGPALILSPAEAREQRVALKVLMESERQTLEAVANVLLPGAAEAGIAYFVDEQLSRPPNDSLLMARYLQVPPPYVHFYRGALQALDGFAQVRGKKPFAELDQATREKLVASLFPEQPEDWRGPPSQPVYLCLRSDSVDVVYGTMDGFAELDIPYLAHIEPAEKW